MLHEIAIRVASNQLIKIIKAMACDRTLKTILRHKMNVCFIMNGYII